MEDEELDLEYRVTWTGGKGGKTGRIRSNLAGARSVFADQLARKSAGLELQVREVPAWNEPMDRQDALDLLGIKVPKDWSWVVPEALESVVAGECSRLYGWREANEAGLPEAAEFAGRVRAVIESGAGNLPEWGS